MFAHVTSTAFVAIMCLLAAASANPASREASAVYTAYPQGEVFSAYVRNAFACQGNYSLCAYAQCKITFISTNPNRASIAECGCYPLNGENYGTTSGMLSQPLKTATAKTCNPPTSGCMAITNKAPMCAAQAPRRNGTVAAYGGKYNLVSTWSPTGWPTTNVSDTACTSGQVTNCYSAACTNKKSWNGAPNTCYCPVYNFPAAKNWVFFTSNPSGACTGSNGFRVGSVVYNGAAVGPKPKVTG